MITGNPETMNSDDSSGGTPTSKFERNLDPEAVTESQELPASGGADAWMTVAGS